MKILLAGAVGAASGSMGGITYSHNRYGAYMRLRSTPTNPNSQRQATVRSLMASLTTLWTSTLTPAQRAQWAVYAAAIPVVDALGVSHYLTGLNHYVRSNLPRLQAGLARVDAGPSTLTLPGEDATFAIAATADDQKIAITFDDTQDWADTDEAGLIIQAHQPKGTGVNFFGGPWRFADSIDGDSGSAPTTGTEIDSPWTLQADQLLTCRARLSLEDGRLSSFFYSTGVSVAAS